MLRTGLPRILCPFIRLMGSRENKLKALFEREAGQCLKLFAFAVLLLSRFSDTSKKIFFRLCTRMYYVIKAPVQLLVNCNFSPEW
jgi:hypothetical protein